MASSMYPLSSMIPPFGDIFQCVNASFGVNSRFESLLLLCFCQPPQLTTHRFMIQELQRHACRRACD
jgi:hypothetical protein